MSGSTAKTGTSVRLAVDVLARKENIRLVSDTVQLFLADGAELRHDEPQATKLRLAIMEAVTNVVRHAYAPDPGGPLGVSGSWVSGTNRYPDP